MDRYLDLNTSEQLPDGDMHLDDVTGDSAAGMTKAQIKQGFMKLEPSPPQYGPQNADDGENYVGSDPFGDRGFLNRPEGWER